MNDELKSADQMTLQEIQESYFAIVKNSPAWAMWFYPRQVWLLSRTWWHWKFEFQYYISIPFWMKTRSIRKKFGWYHYSDDAEGDC